MTDIKIENVVFMDDYQLDILLSKGHRIIYNLKPKLMTARFREVADKETFQKGQVVDGQLIRWNSNTELSLDEVILNIKP